MITAHSLHGGAMNRPMRRVETIDELFQACDERGGKGPPADIVYRITSVVDVNDQPHGHVIHYTCPSGSGRLCGVPMLAPDDVKPATMGTCWQYDGNIDRPTLQPSIQCLCEGCRWHGFITNGELVTL